MMEDTSRAPDDPVIEAELHRALEPYRDLLPQDLFDEIRETLGDALATHPVGVRLVERVRPPPIVAKSGDAEKAGAGDRDDEDDATPGRGQAG